MIVKSNVAFSVSLPVGGNGGLLTSGTVSVVLKQTGSDLVWGTGSGGAYTTRALATLPTATLETSGELWSYTVPAGATNGLADMTQLTLVMVDSTTPSSVLNMSPALQIQVRSANPALIGDNMGSATSVTGAVGSVTGNVGGDVVGKVLGNDASTLVNAGVIGAGGSGTALASPTFGVTVTVKTAGGVLIGGAALSVTGTTTASATTGQDGTALIPLPTGSYTVTASAIGFTFTTASITVGSVNTTGAITATAVGAQSSPASGKALIYGFTSKGSGVTFTFHNLTASATDLTATSSASPNGYFDQGSLVGGQVYRVASSDLTLNGLTIQAPPVGGSATLASCVIPPTV